MLARRWSLAALGSGLLVAFHGVFADDQEFVDWDDLDNLVNNPGFQGLDGGHLGWMFGSGHLGVYEPLAWLAKAVQFAAFGLSPRGFHVVTLLVHLGSVAVLLDVARRILRLSWPGARDDDLDVAAFGAAFLFGVHPLRAEVVAWASGQSYALACLFFLLSLAAYLRHAETGAHRWLALALGGYVAAGLCKSAAVMLPFVLVIVDVYVLRRRLKRHAIEEKVPFYGAMMVLVVVAVVANRGSDSGNVVTLDAPERLGRAVQALPFYIGKMAWPTALAPLYPMDPARWRILSAETLVALAAVSVMGALAVRWRRSRPWLVAALGTYVAVLLPALGLVQHGVTTLAFDRYATIATLGLDVCAGAGVALAWRARWPRYAASGAAALLCVLTAMQVRTWSTAERLWGHALTVEPANALAANNLGWHLMNHQRWAEAEPLFAAAVALEPRSAKFALNEGVALERTRGADEALTFYARALQSLPTVAELHFNRGLILARQGRHAEARAALEQASVLNPEWAAPRQQLARSAREGMPDRAKADGRPPL